MNVCARDGVGFVEGVCLGLFLGFCVVFCVPFSDFVLQITNFRGATSDSFEHTVQMCCVLVVLVSLLLVF